MSLQKIPRKLSREERLQYLADQAAKGTAESLQEQQHEEIKSPIQMVIDRIKSALS